MGKKLLVLAFCLVLAVNSVSCSELSRDNKTTEDNPVSNTSSDDIMDMGAVEGGTLRLFSTPPDTFNPILTKNVYVRDFLSLIYEGLVKLDKTQKPVPVLAESWEISSDGLIWTFHIRKDVFWHDGEPLTSEDIEFTMETILNNKIDTNYKYNLQNVSAFAAVGEYSFKLVLRKANSFTAELMTFPILPKHIFKDKDITKAGKLEAPIGTGPYKFDFYDGKNSVMLVRNDNWANTLPYIKNVEIRIYDNSREAISALHTRDIDMTYVKSGDYIRYGGRADLVIRKYTGRDFEFIALNNKNSALKEKAVRQAIFYAIDKNLLVNDVLSNQGTPAELPIIPETWLYDANAAYVDSDKIKAKELLTDNGWTEKNGKLTKRIDGVNTELSFELMVNEGNKVRSAAAEWLKVKLGEIGINIKIKSIKWEDELKALETGKYDMAILGCSVPSLPDISFLYSTPYFQNYMYSGESAFNMAGYDNQMVNDYIERIFSEKDDSKKKALFLNMKAILDDEVPYIGLFFYEDAILFNKRVRGDLDPCSWNIFNDITKWYIPTN